MRATAKIQSGFSPRLMRSTIILRLGNKALCHFLRYHNNPCLQTGFLPLLTDDDDNSIRDHLHSIYHDNLPPATIRPTVEWLIECVNDDGFLELPDDWSTLAPPDILAQAINHLQAMAPDGVGARDLSECLRLQLAHLPPTPAKKAALRIIDNHLHWLQRKRLDKLPAKNLAAASALLETLSTCPGAAYSPTAAFSLPDIVYSKRGGLWRASAGDGLEISATVNRQAEATAWQRQEAQETIHAIRGRRRCVLRLAQLAADHQSQFFLDGESALRPFPLQDAAKHLQVSTAFISHIVADKVAICANRSFPLKSLFPRRNSSGNIANVALRDKIKQMIATEDSYRPLTDTRLRQQLDEQGLTIPLRTVNWHRRMAGIAPASQRKRLPMPATTKKQ